MRQWGHFPGHPGWRVAVNCHVVLLQVRRSSHQSPRFTIFKFDLSGGQFRNSASSGKTTIPLAILIKQPGAHRLNQGRAFILPGKQGGAVVHRRDARWGERDGMGAIFHSTPSLYRRYPPPRQPQCTFPNSTIPAPVHAPWNAPKVLCHRPGRQHGLHGILQCLPGVSSQGSFRVYTSSVCARSRAVSARCRESVVSTWTASFPPFRLLTVDGGQRFACLAGAKNKFNSEGFSRLFW